ncbi:hypothetical protein BDQ17DRAFT_1364624 [Cyathus striatus]|nr:hypothetical protein BDQ17DRAFT_1364624 [Cyathus striatus]
MHRDALTLDLSRSSPSSEVSPSDNTEQLKGTGTQTEKETETARPPLLWDWNAEHEDRKLERKADAALHGATPFEVDRKLLKDVVREKMGREVGRIRFLSAVTLVDHYELVARVARRFMPRLKTESEVATIHYLREKTKVPVPTIYHYDSNPYNRLGGEFILMSKAPGIPLAQVFHTLPYNTLVKLLKNVAGILISLFSHRFTDIGSLYFGPNPRLVASGAPTPKAAQMHYSAFPFSPTLAMSVSAAIAQRAAKAGTSNTAELKNVLDGVPGLKREHEYHVGPIISWPFFGSNRGELTHPTELNRGPWSSTHSYLTSCSEREIRGVIMENEGRSAPHKLHLDPRRFCPGDESDEKEWEGPGDRMYRDYRRMQRSTFLVAHLYKREEKEEEFGLDCHDLSLENVFVDAEDHTKITCIIDWESTTTRPLWQCAHLFMEVVAQLPNDPDCVHLPSLVAILLSVVESKDKRSTIESLCREWLYHEQAGTRLRFAHRCAEWDGWEEGLVDSILGPEEHEEEWYKPSSSFSSNFPALLGMTSPPPVGTKRGKPRGAAPKLPFVEEIRREQMLNVTGDICGGRGGELGRRLEAWLSVNGNEEEARKVDGRFGHDEPVSAT